jgi:dethiobiotin synthetase
MNRIIFITGTDTGVGKTVLTSLFAAFLRKRGVRVAAFKPVCSGGRSDARLIQESLGGTLTLDEVNPWHFRAPVAPVLAARMEKRRLGMSQVVAHIRKFQKTHDVVLVEGAGGLLSPLGANFDSRDLIEALGASPVIVAANKLGAVNHVLLTLEALPERFRKKARILLMAGRRPDAASRSNADLLAEAGLKKLFQIRWLGGAWSRSEVLQDREIGKTFAALADCPEHGRTRVTKISPD